AVSRVYCGLIYCAPRFISRSCLEETGAFIPSAIRVALVDCHLCRRTTDSTATRNEAAVQAPGSHDSSARRSSSADRASHSCCRARSAAHSVSPYALRRSRQAARADPFLAQGTRTRRLHLRLPESAWAVQVRGLVQPFFLGRFE